MVENVSATYCFSYTFDERGKGEGSMNSSVVLPFLVLVLYYRAVILYLFDFWILVQFDCHLQAESIRPEIILWHANEKNNNK